MTFQAFLGALAMFGGWNFVEQECKAADAKLAYNEDLIATVLNRKGNDGFYGRHESCYIVVVHGGFHALSFNA